MLRLHPLPTRTYGTRPLYPVHVRLQSAYGEHSANRCNSDVIGPFIEPDYSFVRLYLTHQYVFLLRKRNRGSVMGYLIKRDCPARTRHARPEILCEKSCY